MHSEYQLVIIAGGEGKRISHITKGRPKCLLEIEGKTLLDYSLSLYPEIKEVILLLGYGSREVINYVKEKREELPYSSKTIKYAIEEKLLGKGGAIRNALENNIIDRKRGYIIHYPDDLVFEENFEKKLMCQHEKNKEKGKLITIAVVNEVEYPFGRIKVDDNGNVVGFEEKPWIPVMTNIGVYVLEPAANEFIEKYKPPFDFESKVLKELCEIGKAGIMSIKKENWIAVNDEKGFEKAVKKIRELNHL